MQNSCHKTPDTKLSLTNTNHHDAPEENAVTTTAMTQRPQKPKEKKNPVIFFIFYM